MKLRTPLLLGIIIGFVSAASFQASAKAAESGNYGLPVEKVELVWTNLDYSQRKMVDLLAADFFEQNLSANQRSRIMASGARDYASASPQGRQAFRQSRRHTWRALSDQQRAALTRAANGSYLNLTEARKAPFRRYAIDQLGLKPTRPEPRQQTASKRQKEA